MGGLPWVLPVKNLPTQQLQASHLRLQVWIRQTRSALLQGVEPGQSL